MTSDELLDRIASLEFEAEVVASTPRAMRELLRRRHEVLELKKRYREGLATDDLLREFVNGLLQKDAGTGRFPYQTALAAIAVMLERCFTGFAKEYLTDLERIRGARFSMASGVARECLRVRAGASQNDTRLYLCSEPLGSPPTCLAYVYGDERANEGRDWKFVAEMN